MRNVVLLNNKEILEYEDQNLKNELELKNCIVTHLNALDITYQSQHTTLVNKKTGISIENPDLILLRSGGLTLLSKLKALHFKGSTIVNNPIAHSIADDKLHTVQLLSTNNISVPKTILIDNSTNLDLIISITGLPLVIKTITGYKGKGVFLVKDYHSLKSFLDIYFYNNTNYLLLGQEYINKYNSTDLRVWVVGSKVIGGMIRHNPTGDFRANIAQGAIGKKMTLSNELIDLSLKVSQLLGLELSGVDILFDDDGYKICEVNAPAEFFAFDNVLGVNIAKEIIDYLFLKYFLL